MPEYSFVFAGRVGVGKSSLFAYIKNGMAPCEYSGDLGSPVRRSEDDYGLENLAYETTVNGREACVSHTVLSKATSAWQDGYCLFLTLCMYFRVSE